MTNVLIIILLVLLLLKDYISLNKVKHKEKEKVDNTAELEEVQRKQKELQEEFDKIMRYSIEDAINSKKNRGE